MNKSGKIKPIANRKTQVSQFQDQESSRQVNQSYEYTLEQENDQSELGQHDQTQDFIKQSTSPSKKKTRTSKFKGDSQKDFQKISAKQFSKLQKEIEKHKQKIQVQQKPLNGTHISQHKNKSVDFSNNMHDSVPMNQTLKIKNSTELQQDVTENFLQLKRLKDKIRRVFRMHLEETEPRRLTRLSSFHRQVIGDLSDFDPSLENKNPILITLRILKNIMESSLENFFTCIPLLDPLNGWVTFIQILEEIYSVLIFMVYSWFIFYDFWIPDFIFTVSLVGLFVFMVSSVQKMNTITYHDGIQVNNKQNLIELYVRKYLLYDGCAYFALIFHLIYFNNLMVTKVLTLVVFVKLGTFFKQRDIIEEKYNNTTNSVYIWQIFNLFGQAFTLCHFVGTLYHLLAMIEVYYLEEEHSWIQEIDKFDLPWKDRYAESFYWAQATIMLVGSKGDTFLETIYCCCALFGTVGMFATILSKISMVLEDMEKREKDYKKDKEIIQEYCENQGFNSILRGKLLNYLKYQYQGHEDKKQNQEMFGILEKFPSDLQEEVKQEKYEKELKKFDVLRRNFTEKSVEKLINIIQEEYYMPGESIFLIGQPDKAKLYLLQKGTVQLCHEFPSKIKVGGCFGEKAFFSDTYPLYSAFSQDFTTILTINRKEFCDMLTDLSQEDQEKFYMFKDEILTDGICEKVEKACRICNRDALHTEENCNLVSYYPYQPNFLRRLTKSEPQDRVKSFLINEIIYQNGRPKEKTRKIFIQRRDLREWKIFILAGSESDNLLRSKIIENTNLRIFVKPILTTMEEYFEKFNDEISNYDSNDAGSDYISDDELENQKSSDGDELSKKTISEDNEEDDEDESEAQRNQQLKQLKLANISKQKRKILLGEKIGEQLPPSINLGKSIFPALPEKNNIVAQNNDQTIIKSQFRTNVKLKSSNKYDVQQHFIIDDIVDMSHITNGQLNKELSPQIPLELTDNFQETENQITSFIDLKQVENPIKGRGKFLQNTKLQVPKNDFQNYKDVKESPQLNAIQTIFQNKLNENPQEQQQYYVKFSDAITKHVGVLQDNDIKLLNEQNKSDIVGIQNNKKIKDDEDFFWLFEHKHNFAFYYPKCNFAYIFNKMRKIQKDLSKQQQIRHKSNVKSTNGTQRQRSNVPSHIKKQNK